MPHGKSIRQRYFVRTSCMKYIWLSLNLKTMWRKKSIRNKYCLLMSNEYIKGILVFLFIVNETINKHRDAEMLC